MPGSQCPPFSLLGLWQFSLRRESRVYLAMCPCVHAKLCVYTKLLFFAIILTVALMVASAHHLATLLGLCMVVLPEA